jgi:predicted nuclease of restriction endonuclease-like (RecB) superfamily
MNEKSITKISTVENRKTKVTITNNRRIDILYKNIVGYIREAKNRVLQKVNAEQVKAYWAIGRDIVEEEQAGKERAEYGAFLLEEISNRLVKEFGNGFGVRTLIDIRKFYLTYSSNEINNKKGKTHALRAKSQVPEFNSNLSWTHYRALMSEPRDEVRNFYEVETLKNCWSARELERQMASLLFERLAKSKNKSGLMKLACRGQEIIKPEDAVKELVVLEFLNIPESHKLIESKLEEALISNMQNFLLEMGRGFAFVARQKRLTLDGKHFYCDLVFYHHILKRFILMDLKTHELSHADLGQMQLYVNYFDMEEKAKDDNPTIGLILCTKQSKKMVKYFFGNKEQNIYARKYQFYLPSEKELEMELKKEIKKIKHGLKYKAT